MFLKLTPQSMNPRDVAELQEAATPLGITLEKTHGMPANNLLLHFRKA